MYETSYKGIHYCFYDDKLTLNGNVVPYEKMVNIRHRGGSDPAFLFEYKDKTLALPYPEDEYSAILPFMQKAASITPAPDPIEDLLVETSPVEPVPVVPDPIVIPDPPPVNTFSDSAESPSLDKSVPGTSEAPSPIKDKKHNKKLGCLIPIAVLVLLLIALVSCFGSGDDTSEDTDVQDDVVVTEEATEEATEAPTTAPDPANDLNTEEKNAYKKGLDYLDYSGFSRTGLIEQLEYEGYPSEACEKAVSVIEEKGEVDWNEECLEKAKDYMDYSSFSKDGLIDQLKYEGFTDDQINAIIDEAYQ